MTPTPTREASQITGLKKLPAYLTVLVDCVEGSSRGREAEILLFLLFSGYFFNSPSPPPFPT